MLVLWVSPQTSKPSVRYEEVGKYQGGIHHETLIPGGQMLVNFDPTSLTDDALQDKIAQVLKCMNMVGYGNNMSYESLSTMLSGLRDEQTLRFEKRMAADAVKRSRDVDTTVRSTIASKQQAKPKGSAPAKGSVSMAKPSFVRSKAPASDNI